MSNEILEAVPDTEAKPRMVKIQVWRWKTYTKKYKDEVVSFMSEEYRADAYKSEGDIINHHLTSGHYQLHRIDCFYTLIHEGGSTDILQWRFEQS